MCSLVKSAKKRRTRCPLWSLTLVINERVPDNERAKSTTVSVSRCEGMRVRFKGESFKKIVCGLTMIHSNLVHVIEAWSYEFGRIFNVDLSETLENYRKESAQLFLKTLAVSIESLCKNYSNKLKVQNHAIRHLTRKDGTVKHARL